MERQNFEIRIHITVRKMSTASELRFSLGNISHTNIFEVHKILPRAALLNSKNPNCGGCWIWERQKLTPFTAILGFVQNKLKIKCTSISIFLEKFVGLFGNILRYQ